MSRHSFTQTTRGRSSREPTVLSFALTDGAVDFITGRDRHDGDATGRFFGRQSTAGLVDWRHVDTALSTCCDGTGRQPIHCHTLTIVSAAPGIATPFNTITVIFWRPDT